MRMVLFLVTVLTLGVLASTVSSREKLPKNLTSEKISFYEVPLVCGAAPDIGCGSRAKPVLLEMEKNPAIKEAWLNRAGTVYAIVWNKSSQTKRVARPIFKKWQIEFTELGEAEKNAQLATFRQEGKWYRGAAVDQLSLEEAETIGNRVINMLLPGGYINQKEADAIRKDVTAYFKEELVRLRTYEELCRDSDNKFQQAIIGIAEKHLGKERTKKIVDIFGKKRELNLPERANSRH